MSVGGGVNGRETNQATCVVWTGHPRAAGIGWLRYSTLASTALAAALSRSAGFPAGCFAGSLAGRR